METILTNDAFQPTIYLKQGCPFCMKVDIFVLEAGLRDKVKIRRFVAGTDEEQTVRAELEPHLTKVSFPAAHIAPDRYVADSDGINEELANQNGIDKANLVTLRYYIEGPFQAVMNLYGENMKLKDELSKLKQ